MSFSSLGLSDSLLKAIQQQGYTTPSAIQAKAIPEILKGKDVLASAQTGTGKTAGFTLPMLQILSERHLRKRPIRALVLTPTRELAAQVHENILQYGKFLELRSTVIFGGVNANPQIKKIQRGIDILVATPGRLLDLEGQGVVRLNQIEMLVLDEADRMLDMGFLRDIKRVLAKLPNNRQNLLFSATFSKEIKKLATSLLNNPVRVEATPENTTVDRINQRIYHVDKKKKPGLILHLIKEGNWHQVLVFTRTKYGANRLAEKLTKNGISAMPIHGNKSQNARTKALSGFKKGDVRVLVATDIAARGLDIPLLPHVVNFEIPNVPEDYVHRIGRTGRAGANGEAVSLVSAEEAHLVKGIEKLLGHKLEYDTVQGFEPSEAPIDTAAQPKSEANFKKKPGGNNRRRPYRHNRKSRSQKTKKPNQR
ncbi:MAG: DEAD/DEAH box helicase [Bacteroidia bacterium]|nr:DEAD/DEAH box helicase [Bacteroidia bacterium]